MSLGTAIVALKTADSTLNTLVGTRCHPRVINQQQTLPAICFWRVSTDVPHSFGIDVPALSGPLVAMKAYAASESALTTLTDAMITAFSKKTEQTAGGMKVKSEWTSTVSGGVEKLNSGAEAYVDILYFRFWIKEV